MRLVKTNQIHQASHKKHNFSMTVFFFITHIRQFSSNQTNQIKCIERGKKGGQDYYELIKAKSLNFPSKKQPLPVTPSPDPTTISQVEVLKINPRFFFFKSQRYQNK